MLTVHIPGEKLDLLSQSASGFQRGVVLGALLDRLVHHQFNANQLEPGLLETWSTPDMGKSWRLKLKANLIFHHGRGVTSRDLEFSFGNILSSKINSPDRSCLSSIIGIDEVKRGAMFSSGSVSGLKIEDELTLLVCLCEPNLKFMELLDSPSLSPVPRECVNIIEDASLHEAASSGSHLLWKEHPIGAGPYRIDSIQDDGARLNLSRFYQSACNYPWLNTSAKNLSVYTGQLQPKTNVSLGGVPAGNTSFQVVSAPTVERMVGLYFNYRLPVVREADFRRAIDLCIDRMALAEASAAKGTFTIVPTSMNHTCIRNVRHCDPERASSIFEALRIEYPELNSLKVQLGTGVRPAWTEVLEQNLIKAGLHINFSAEPKSMNFNSHEAIPFSFGGFIPSVACSRDIFRIFKSGGGWVAKLNQKDERYETLLQQPPNEDTDGALAQRFYDECYAIPLFETAPTYYFDESVLSMNETTQTYDVYLDKIAMR